MLHRNNDDDADHHHHEHNDGDVCTLRYLAKGKKKKKLHFTELNFQLKFYIAIFFFKKRKVILQKQNIL